MDDKRFDALARSMASASRRSVLKTAVSASLAMVGLAVPAGALAQRAPGQLCRKDGDCASGVCGPRDRFGRSRCLCVSVADCPPGDQCLAAACEPDGVCQLTPLTGASCDDGDLCTVHDTCDARGRCLGTPIVCTPADQCHVAGVCDPATGVCTDPPAPDGTSCDDGDACTQTDGCLSGSCVGGNPVVCVAQDQCHVAGVCDPVSGTCSHPVVPDGTSCDDGNACTQTDTCQNGSCIGGNPVVCPRPNSCYNAGICDPTTGTCSAPTLNTDLLSDANNCGTCGTQCAPGEACVNGACTCVDTANSCGTCGNRCGPNETCQQVTPSVEQCRCGNGPACAVGEYCGLNATSTGYECKQACPTGACGPSCNCAGGPSGDRCFFAAQYLCTTGCFQDSDCGAGNVCTSRVLSGGVVADNPCGVIPTGYDGFCTRILIAGTCAA